jgi:hypothetical protein
MARRANVMDPATRIFAKLPLSRRIAWLLMLLGAGFGVCLAVTYTPTITRVIYDSIEEGMSEDQIVSLVGGPPGSYEWLLNPSKIASSSWTGEWTSPKSWVVDGCCLTVYFSQDGRACNKSLVAAAPEFTNRATRKRTVFEWLFHRTRPSTGGVVYTHF